jgi:hypothetical protein
MSCLIHAFASGYKLPTTEIVTVHARLISGRVWSRGSAHSAELASPLLLMNPEAEGFALYLQLASEGLSDELSHLREGPWMSNTGTLYCSGTDELCCPFNFGRVGELTNVRVTGRILEEKLFYADRQDEVPGAFLVQTLCRP